MGIAVLSLTSSVPKRCCGTTEYNNDFKIENN
jgi:hypothetical protein